MRRRWRRTEEVSSEAATTSWSNGGFLVDRLTVVFGYVLWYDMLYIRTYGCSFPSHSLERPHPHYGPRV